MKFSSGSRPRWGWMSKADIIRAKKRERHLAWVLCTQVCLKAELYGSGKDRRIRVLFPGDPDRYHLVSSPNTSAPWWILFHDRQIRRMAEPHRTGGWSRTWMAF